MTPGGACTGDGNLLSENFMADGVYVDSDSPGTIIRNNFIGTDVTGLFDRGNSADGLTIESGGSVLIEGNLISGNGNDGIDHIAGSGPSEMIARGNKIGTDTTGTIAVPNQRGIHLDGGTSGAVIGGPVPADRNIISGNDGNPVINTGFGVHLDNSASGNIVQGTVTH